MIYSAKAPRTVYLSRGSISCSVGISAFQRSRSLIVPCRRAWSPRSCSPATCTLCSVNSGTISPCLGPLPCLRASWSAFLSASSKRFPSAVLASSSAVGLPWRPSRLMAVSVDGVVSAGNFADVNDAACRLSALSRTATMLSTLRNRLRCRSFWGRESR